MKSYFHQDTSDDAIQISPDQSEIVWSPDSRVLARYSGLSGLTLWDVAAGSLMRQMQPPEKMVSLSWSGDSKLLRVGTVHQFQFLHTDTGMPAFVLKSGEGDQWMRTSAVSVNGEPMAASLDDGEILLWKVGDHRRKVRVQTGILADKGVMVSPDLKKMAQSPGRIGPPSGICQRVQS